MCYFIISVCYFQNEGQMARQAFAGRFAPAADGHSTGVCGPEGALLSVHPKPSLTAVRDDSLVECNRSHGARARNGLPRLQRNVLLVYLVREGPPPCSICCCLTCRKLGIKTHLTCARADNAFALFFCYSWLSWPSLGGPCLFSFPSSFSPAFLCL